MKILIVTAWYAPFIHPRAYRWTTLAEHWASEGHEVHVLTTRIRERDKNEIQNGVQVHRVGFDSLKEWVYYWFGTRSARGRVGQAPNKPGLFVEVLSWVYNTVWKNLYFPDDACIWYFPAKWKLRQLLESERFDVMITVSLPFTGHLLGLSTRPTALSRRTGRKPFWLADVGDPFSFQAGSPNNRFFYTKINWRLERQILETADATTVTTEATLRKYRVQFGEQAVSKMAVIPPILTKPINQSPINQSPITNQPINQSPITNQPINQSPINQSPINQSPITRIGYFGALYAPTRTPDAFLDLLAQSFALRPDLRENLEVHFYGEIFPEFFEKLNSATGIQLHGLCSREAAWAAMQEMDILLNIGNTTDFQLPSKAVDYLAAGKPVLNLSYTENDPFAEFFANNSLIINLKIENGRASNDEAQRWLEWFDMEKPGLNEAEIAERVEPFLVENVANQYLVTLQENQHVVV